MNREDLPNWLMELELEDIGFIRNFILASGSLKEIAKQYEVTYPTIRLRLDKLIQKIQINEAEKNKPYVSLIKKLAIDEKIDLETAKVLINAYNSEKEMI